MNLPSHIICQTSTIADGNMGFRFGPAREVIENRKNFLAKLGVEWDNHIAMKCDHGSKITNVNISNFAAYLGADSPEKMIESEVLVTNEKNLALMLMTADCLPTTFYDPVTEVIALAHLNRKTIAFDLGQTTVGFLTKEYGTNPADLLVNIGPHIKIESYKFPLPLNEPTPIQIKDFIEERDGFAYVDLAAAELNQLKRVGVNVKNIVVSAVDTATSAEHFSHYRSTRNPDDPEKSLATVAMIVA